MTAATMLLTTQVHVLVVTSGPDDKLSYQVQCPGVTDQCRRYEDCGASPDESLALTEAVANGWDVRSHGRHHRRIAGVWMQATDHCYVASHHALQERATAAGPGPGRYPILWSSGDAGTDLEISPLCTTGPEGHPVT